MDLYAKRFVDAIRKAKTRKELEAIINKNYENGFEDGANSQKECACGKE